MFHHFPDCPLKLQGFSSTLTEPVDSQGRGLDQIKEMELKLHPKLKEPLKRLCDDPKTTVVVLSGRQRDILDNVNFSFLICSFSFYCCPILKYSPCFFPQRTLGITTCA